MYWLERAGKRETRKVSLDVPAASSTGKVVPRSSNIGKWQLQTHSLMPSGLQHACLCLCLEAASQVWHYTTKMYVLHKAGRPNTVSLLFCEGVHPFKYQMHGYWGKQVFSSELCILLNNFFFFPSTKNLPAMSKFTNIFNDFPASPITDTGISSSQECWNVKMPNVKTHSACTQFKKQQQ